MTETPQPYVDPHHRLSDEDWAKVVRRAKEVRQEEQDNAQGGAASGIAQLLDMTAAGIRSKKYFPVSGIPTQLLVLHSGESPLKGGYAKSLTEWASSIYPADPIASWTWFVDPLHIVAFIPPELGAWHASEANNLSEGFEQSGYARFSRAEWLTADGLVQLESLAWLMAQRAVANGIPARWLTTDEVTRACAGDRSVKGLCLHRQIDPETRTDPGNGYPLDLLLSKIQFYINNGATTPEATTQQEEDQNMKYLVQQKGQADIWIGDMITRRRVPSPAVLQSIQFVATKSPGQFFDGGKVQIWDDINILGADVVDETAVRTLTKDFKWWGFDGKTQPEGSRGSTNLVTDIGWADAARAGTNGLIHGLSAQVATLAGLLAEQPGSNVTKEEILDRVGSEFKGYIEQFKPVLVEQQQQ